MRSDSENQNAWVLTGTTAYLFNGPLKARLDVARPDLGLQQIQLEGRDLPGQLVAIRRQQDSDSESVAWPLRLADAYVRSNDLVATYRPIDDWPYSPQLYWRASPMSSHGELLAAVSLLVSVETHLLDTWPRIAINSQLACRELRGVNTARGTSELLSANRSLCPGDSATCVLCRLTGIPVSYAEIMPACDFRELVIRENAKGACYADWQLFADFLEKGVIRRARLQAAFIRSADDVAAAIKCSKATEQERLPLTT